MLDEGFGTLDAATLDTVAATLENLAARGDRMVGVVTHVRGAGRAGPGAVRGAARTPARAHVDRSGAMTEYFVDTWDPAYGPSFEAPARPAAQSTAQINTDVELPAAAWRPLTAPPTSGRPTWCCWSTACAGSTRALWTREDDGTSHPGLAASYAAGVVRCDLRAGAAALAGARVERGLFTTSPDGRRDIAAGRSATRVRQMAGAAATRHACGRPCRAR